MSTSVKYAIGAVVALVLFLLLPGWLKLTVLAVPVVGYLALDSTQRRRLRGVSRRRIGR